MREEELEDSLEEAKKKKGLWANIHAKRKRGERPAKPGDAHYPEEKTWKKLAKESLRRMIRDLVKEEMLK